MAADARVSASDSVITPPGVLSEDWRSRNRLGGGPSTEDDEEEDEVRSKATVPAVTEAETEAEVAVMAVEVVVVVVRAAEVAASPLLR